MINLVPSFDGHMFYIEVTGGDNAYADTAEDAFSTYHQLKKDRGIKGTKAIIKNLVTGKVVLNEN